MFVPYIFTVDPPLFPCFHLIHQGGCHRARGWIACNLTGDCVVVEYAYAGALRKNQLNWSANNREIYICR